MNVRTGYMNVLHPKIVPDSFENSAEVIGKQAELSHLVCSWKIYNRRQGRNQKQIMTDAMSKKWFVTVSMSMFFLKFSSWVFTRFMMTINDTNEKKMTEAIASVCMLLVIALKDKA